ncbi:MAG TPA: hypothetical protein VME01_09470 [Solirubrobacteraceae bacterium]|nr:hypothetical protein [Solirubrobacteraceae bacterium]
MVLPPGHRSEVNRRRALAPRERRMALFGAVLTGLVLIAVVVAVVIPGKAVPKGCLDVMVPSSTGAQAIHQCGPLARSICQTLGTPSGYNGRLADQYLAPACRRAGLPVG